MSKQKPIRSKAELETAIEAYFDSIRRILPLTEQRPLLEPDGRLAVDEKGKPIYEQAPLVNPQGQPLFREEFVTPPSLLGLCRSLGISLAAWSRYEKRPAFAQATTSARERIAQYLEEQLIENPRAARGVILNLTANFGWASRQEPEAEEARRDWREQDIPLQEKLALLHTLAQENGAEGGPGDSEEELQEQEEAETR